MKKKHNFTPLKYARINIVAKDPSLLNVEFIFCHSSRMLNEIRESNRNFFKENISDKEKVFFNL